jgi:hypothetical protein
MIYFVLYSKSHRGKLLNVRDATHKQIMDNEEITALKQILGLQHGKTYDNVNSLRYGHIMIMADQVTISLSLLNHYSMEIKTKCVNELKNLMKTYLHLKKKLGS